MIGKVKESKSEAKRSHENATPSCYLESTYK